jgi:hypothetical protein
MSLAALRSNIQSHGVYKADGTCGGSGADNQNNTYGWGRVSVAGPTSVELARFVGWAERKAIHLEWETASEVGSLGFNLYRATAPDGPYTQLNAVRIPSQVPGQPGGAVYAWTDADVRPARMYYYKLEELDIYGGSTLHGPLDVKSAPAERGQVNGEP